MFYPKQLLLDSIAILVVFVVLFAILHRIPAELGRKPIRLPIFCRPPWYFLPLFELLKYFPGKLSLIPTVILPGLLFGILFLLPFFDRREVRHPLRRPIATALMGLTLIASVGLIFISKYQDRHDPEASAKLKKQEEDSRTFLKSAFKPEVIGKKLEKAAAFNTSTGAPTEGIKGTPPDPYTETCSLCHGDHGEGADPLGPPLAGVTAKPNRTKADLFKLLNDPRSYGLKDPMPDKFPKLTDDDKRAIIEWLSTSDK